MALRPKQSYPRPDGPLNVPQPGSQDDTTKAEVLSPKPGGTKVRIISGPGAASKSDMV